MMKKEANIFGTLIFFILCLMTEAKTAGSDVSPVPLSRFSRLSSHNVTDGEHSERRTVGPSSKYRVKHKASDVREEEVPSRKKAQKETLRHKRKGDEEHLGHAPEVKKASNSVHEDGAVHYPSKTISPPKKPSPTSRVSASVIQFIEQQPETWTLQKWIDILRTNHKITEEEAKEQKFRNCLRLILQHRNCLKSTNVSLFNKEVKKWISKKFEEDRKSLPLDDWVKELTKAVQITEAQAEDQKFRTKLGNLLSKRKVIVRTNAEVITKKIKGWVTSYVEKEGESFIKLPINDWVQLLQQADMISAEKVKDRYFKNHLSEFLRSKRLLAPTDKRESLASELKEKISNILEDMAEECPLCFHEWLQKLKEQNLITEDDLKNDKFKYAIYSFLNDRDVLMRQNTQVITPVIKKKIEDMAKTEHRSLTLEEWAVQLTKSAVISESDSQTPSFRGSLGKALSHRKLLAPSKKEVITSEIQSWVQEQERLRGFLFQLTIKEWFKALEDSNLLPESQIKDAKFKKGLYDFLDRRGLIASTSKVEVITSQMKRKISEISSELEEDLLTLGEWVKKLQESGLVSDDTAKDKKFKNFLLQYLKRRNVLAPTNKTAITKEMKVKISKIKDELEGNKLNIEEWINKLKKEETITQDEGSNKKFRDLLRLYLERQGLLKASRNNKD
ncbi:MAG: hypothetical protein ACK5PQ_04565 [Alphaproteobacteria bacterium]